MPRDTVQENLSSEDTLKELNRQIRNLNRQINTRKSNIDDIEKGEPKRLSIFEEIHEREQVRKALQEDRKKLRAFMKEQQPSAAPVTPFSAKPIVKDKPEDSEKPEPKADKENTKPDEKTSSPVPVNVLSNASRARVFRPFAGGLAIGTVATIGAKIIATTALTTIVPFAAPLVGFAFGYGSNLANDKINGAKFFSRKTHMNALRTGFVAALGASIIPGADLLGVDFGEIFNSLTGSEAIAAPVLEQAPTEAAPVDAIPTTEAPIIEEPSDEATDAPVVDGGVVDITETAPTPSVEETASEVAPAEEIVTIQPESITDLGGFLDGAQNDLELAQSLLSDAEAYGVDPADYAFLEEQVETGFDFIDTASSVASIEVFNGAFEAAIDPGSAGGAGVTPEEYAEILKTTFGSLQDAQFIVEDPNIIQDTYVDAGQKSATIEQYASLKAAMG